MNEDALNAVGSEALNPDDDLFRRRFSSLDEALAASEEILSRYGWDSDIVRRHRFTPVNVPFEL